MEIDHRPAFENPRPFGLDVFVSATTEPHERTAAENMVLALRSAHLNTYLCIDREQSVQSIRNRALTPLVNSRCCVLLISQSTVDELVTLDERQARYPATWSVPIIEWELASDLHHRTKMTVVPVLIGQSTGDGKLVYPVINLDEIPDISTSTNPQSNVRETVKYIMQLNPLHWHPIKFDETLSEIQQRMQTQLIESQFVTSLMSPMSNPNSYNGELDDDRSDLVDRLINSVMHRLREMASSQRVPEQDAEDSDDCLSAELEPALTPTPAPGITSTRDVLESMDGSDDSDSGNDKTAPAPALDHRRATRFNELQAISTLTAIRPSPRSNLQVLNMAHRDSAQPVEEFNVAAKVVQSSMLGVQSLLDQLGTLAAVRIAPDSDVDSTPRSLPSPRVPNFTSGVDQSPPRFMQPLPSDITDGPTDRSDHEPKDRSDHIAHQHVDDHHNSDSDDDQEPQPSNRQLL